MAAESTPQWHTLSVKETLESLGTDPEGLTGEEAAARLERYGANALPPPPRRTALRRFLAQFENLLIYVLLAAAAVTALLAHWVDTVVILLVVLVNAVIGFVQEGKAEEALEAVRKMLSQQATVLRDGQRRTIPADALVPGDIVYLEPGDKVSADLRLVRVKELRIDESVLTGESVAVGKQLEVVAGESPLGDRKNLAFSGTLVTAGHGRGVVIGTGTQTEIGRISQLLTEVETIATPLVRKMNAFSKQLTLAILSGAAFMFAFGMLVRDYSASDMFMAVVGLAVAAIPEGLPAIMTVTLAIGVQTMARRHAIIRRLPAVETLGSVTVICSDKTGTLTKNEMTVQSVITAGTDFAVSGAGYAPHGSFTVEGREIEPEDAGDLRELTRAAALCNDAGLRRENGHWFMEGDPTEGALLSVAIKAGYDLSLIAGEYPRLDVIPFESQHRFMATLHHDHAGHSFIYMKGAPEVVLSRCHRQRREGNDEPIDIALWKARGEALAATGQRVLAIAHRSVAPEQSELQFVDAEQGFTLLGLVGIMDPPREEVIDAIRECHTAGIRVKMITGDHAATARAIAARIGIRAERAITGEELSRMTPEELRRQVMEVDVFARTSPEHKLQLVEALQAEGNVTAMTGDGVNDAPALRRADVGVAMGKKGTEAAKEASEVVLTDDNFASITRAVREGRTVYDNLKKAILFLLPVNGGESLSLVAAILAGYTLPISPLQILWVNMVSSVALAMALAFEPSEKNVMNRPPRPPAEPIFSGTLIWRIVFVSFLFLIGVFGMFLAATARGMEVEVARTLAVNTLVAMEVFYLFSVRYFSSSLTLTALVGTRAVLVAVAIVALLQLVFTYAPFMQEFFASRPLSLLELAAVVGVGIAAFLILEIEKLVRRRLVGRPA